MCFCLAATACKMRARARVLVEMKEVWVGSQVVVVCWSGPVRLHLPICHGGVQDRARAPRGGAIVASAYQSAPPKSAPHMASLRRNATLRNLEIATNMKLTVGPANDT